MNERLSFLSERYDNLRRSERKVADSVLANAEQIIHYSVSQLAEEAKVSDPTVIRFCRSLGFKGFQDFKIRLAQSVVPTVRTIHESVDENSEVPDLVQRVFEANIDAVRSTLKTLDFLTVGAARRRASSRQPHHLPRSGRLGGCGDGRLPQVLSHRHPMPLVRRRPHGDHGGVHDEARRGVRRHLAFRREP